MRIASASLETKNRNQWSLELIRIFVMLLISFMCWEEVASSIPRDRKDRENVEGKVCVEMKSWLQLKKLLEKKIPETGRNCSQT